MTSEKIITPWGSYEVLASGQYYQVKRLTIQPGQATSLQVHLHRAEHWAVVQGIAATKQGYADMLLNSGEAAFIPRGRQHRLENPGDIPLEIIETQWGSYLGEDDIVRLEDRYGRTEKA